MNRKTWPFLVAVVLLCAAPALAGPLASDPTAYIDGTSFQWTGTTAFSNTSGLAGNLDWVVYAPGTFPAGFGGYTPTPGEFVYAYQVVEHGSISLSQVAVKLLNPADNIGSFSGNLVIGNPSTNVNGDSAIDSFISPLTPTGSANWLFNGILPGSTSVGLAFSSPNVPMFTRGTTIDHGTVAAVIPVPSPDSVGIPEPGTLTLAVCGLAAFGLHWLRRRGRKSS